MRQIGDAVMAVLALLVLVLGAAGVRAEQPTKKTEKNSWWNPVGWWQTKEKEPKPKAKPTQKKEDAAKKKDQKARARLRYQNAYLRREQVCDRLREIAQQTGNPQLARQAEELRQMAWELYLAQTKTPTASLPAPAPASPPVPTPAEEQLAERLGDKNLEARIRALLADDPGKDDRQTAQVGNRIAGEQEK